MCIPPTECTNMVCRLQNLVTLSRTYAEQEKNYIPCLKSDAINSRPDERNNNVSRSSVSQNISRKNISKTNMSTTNSSNKNTSDGNTSSKDTSNEDTSNRQPLVWLPPVKPEDFRNGNPPPVRTTPCSRCKLRHIACDREKKLPDVCSNCARANANCVV
ncbi:hypothetical protein BD410DRAFT_183797 [Rickenella mellea]|uniref:Zn(2)-C6 fungal-type domain-containing protein n=1 Tax=Rickenella mellea TaxID=50990 RepID=A0A4Y7Q7Q6_9AGAM|nr:hypothetical protein BD410DRAFT_183797 [Rickenella mellea]